MVVTDLPELKEAVCVLEAYDIQRCRDYPSTSPIVAGSLQLAEERGPLALIWQLHNRVIDCGQHCIVAPGAIELHCR